jgi:hypothetical protein
MAFSPKTHLARQLRFLERDCASYDTGATDEAVRMAVVMRVLLHQTPHFTSLLTHLGAPQVTLASSSSSNIGLPGVIYAFGLGTVHQDRSGTRYIPLLENVPGVRWLSAPAWWDGECQIFCV